MQSIHVRYLSCTNTKPKRVCVQTSGGIRRVYSCYFLEELLEKAGWSLSADSVIDFAVQQFLTAVQWSGEWVQGHTKTGFVYVCLTGSTVHKEA